MVVRAASHKSPDPISARFRQRPSVSVGPPLRAAASPLAAGLIRPSVEPLPRYRSGVETNTCARSERMHQVDNLFEQQQLRRVCPQPCSNQHAVEFSGRKRACDHLLGGCSRREQATFAIIATLSQQFELTGNVGSNEIRRQGTKT
jgi:hypothetical protein